MSISKAYDSWAEQYDNNINKTRDLDKIATIKTLSEYCFDHILELGCGTGKNTEWLLQKATDIVAIDFSEAMLNVAKSKINNSIVSFAQSDIKESWPVEDASLDLITCNLILEHIEDLTPIFAQAYHKLRKGGIFFVSEFHPFKQYTGSGARYIDEHNNVVNLEVYTHHTADFTKAALSQGFVIQELNEWFDDNNDVGIPRLISFVFKK